MTMILPGALPQSASGPRPDATVKFTGNGGEFVGLCARGALLQLVTFGFYRFWLATDIRRHLWSHTSIDGEPLEYTGRGRELVIGFLIALAVLVPVNIVYFLIGIEAEQAKAFASIPLFLFYALFGQFAVFRARRYRLTRTIWRGVRFWMTGSGWNYAFRWLGWALFATITLGLAYPWMRASLERYKFAHTYYGDLRGSFVGRPSEFLRRGIGLWLFCIMPLLLLVAGGVINIGLKEIGLSEIDAVKGSGRDGAAAALLIIGVIWLLAAPFVWPFFRALEWRWWAKGVRFGELSLTSDLRGAELLKTYVKLFLMAMLVSSVMSMVVALIGVIVVSGFGLKFSQFDPENLMSLARNIPIIAAVAIGYLVVLLSIGVVQRFFLTREMWRIIATSIIASHIESADGVAARGEAANALGEGLADGLDVAGF